MKFKSFFKGVLFTTLVSGCASYKSNVMFSANTTTGEDWFIASEYFVNPGDEIQFSVMPIRGEGLIIGAEEPEHSTVVLTVNSQGEANVPIIGKLYLEGLTLRQLDSTMVIQFRQLIKEPFVSSKFLNKRATVFGTSQTQVVPLSRERIRLSEVIASCGGILPESKASNIRVLREDKIFLADLSRAETRMQNDIFIRPDDLIYIEPVRRPLREGFRDATPVITTLTSVLTIVTLIFTLL